MSNYSDNIPVNLKIQSLENEFNNTEVVNFLVEAGGTFMLSTSEITGSTSNSLDFTYDNIDSVSVEPSGSDAKIEYFIATT